MLFGARGDNLPSRFLGEIPTELVDHEATPGPTTGWSSSPLGAGTATPPEPRPRLELAVGDDVVHGSFGEGVVTGVEPGVVAVRFAQDGTERKLMADYAPLRKAS
jgi:DNA helicase-2/ATP-dependent DNA helicase PcrA